MDSQKAKDGKIRDFTFRLFARVRPSFHEHPFGPTKGNEEIDELGYRDSPAF